MIVYFPSIYPDELVYSWFCRYYVHSGCFSHKEALQELYCKRSDYLNKEFIGNLNHGAMEKINEIYPIDELVLDHTMYPQYARFIPLEKKKEALYRLVHEPCDVHHLFCVLPRNEGEQYLKFCPLCAKEDREVYGEVYWHRKHQIRNMSICRPDGAAHSGEAESRAGAATRRKREVKCCTNFLMMFVQFMVPFPLAIMPVQSEHVCDRGTGIQERRA